jgi:isopenicillin N synthase-like dioxygenase
MKLDNRLSPHFRGYTRMGTEVTQGRADAREQIDYSPEREPVPDYPAEQPYWLLQGPIFGRRSPFRSSNRPPWSGRS